MSTPSLRRASVLLLIAGCSRTDLTAYGSGTHAGDSDESPPIQGAVPVAAVYPTNGADWNDYVSNTGGGRTAWTRPDTPCATSENYYFGCLHGGELRQLSVPGQSSCAGLTAEDELGAFVWSCSDATSPVLFRSRGLSPGKGLRDLVTATGFIPNRVTVFASGHAVFQTPRTVWWQNPVARPPANPLVTDAPVALGATRTIYVIDADTLTSGYSLYGATSDKVALVTLGNATLSYSGYANGWCTATTGAVGSGNRVLICDGGARFAWLELRLAGNIRRLDHGIYLGDGVQFTRVHDTEVAGGSTLMTNGITLDTTQPASNRSNLVDGSNVHEVSGLGFYTLANSTYDTFIDCRSTANGTGFYLGAYSGNSHKVLFRAIASNNTGPGLDVDFLDEIYSVVQLAAVNNGAEGVTMAGNYGDYQAITSAQNALHQLNYRIGGNPFLEVFSNIAGIAADGTATGLHFECAEHSRVGDVLGAYATIGIDVAASATNLEFLADDVLVGHNGIDCSNGANIATLDGAGSNTCNHGPGLTRAPVTGIDPRGSFVGVVAENDVANGSTQTAGTALFPVSDWVHFRDPWRSWGVGGSSSLFAAALAGSCRAGQTCQIFDWRLKANDTVLLDHYGRFPTDGGTCPSSVDASVAANVLIDFSAGPVRYLRAAVEVMDPVLNPNGNYNGLCESNEACIYTPNLGAYQGSGDFTTRTCSGFVGGNGVTNVSLYAYPSNGQ